MTLWLVAKLRFETLKLVVKRTRRVRVSGSSSGTTALTVPGISLFPINVLRGELVFF